jgi:hypothetical protein
MHQNKLQNKNCVYLPNMQKDAIMVVPITTEAVSINPAHG